MPVWEAQYTMVIASRTGWTEEYIRHELPLCRGWAYYHAARVMEGQRFRWAGGASTVGRWIRNVREWAGKRYGVRSLRGVEQKDAKGAKR